ncbi:MAG TPA: hypothetical protein DC054_04380 [Blastocatellia bacterium]|nr:hypothetical protein [Blastocatellia bacterium]
MPLTIDGTALNPEVAEAPEPHILDVRHRPQEGKLWCWAACVQMVLEYYERTKPESGIKNISQCDIVGKMEGHSANPCADDPQMRVDSCGLDQMKQVWVACNIQEDLRDPPAVLTMVGIKQQIKDGKPIEVGITWGSGGGHAMLIKGWAATNPETLVIDDPLRESSLGDDPFLETPLGVEADGSGRTTHADLKDALGRGQWTRTWFNLA